MRSLRKYFFTGAIAFLAANCGSDGKRHDHQDGQDLNLADPVAEEPAAQQNIPVAAPAQTKSNETLSINKPEVVANPSSTPVVVSQPENYQSSAGYKVIAEISLLDGCKVSLERNLAQPVLDLSAEVVPNIVEYKVSGAKGENLEIISSAAGKVIRHDFIEADAAAIAKLVDALKRGKEIEITADQKCAVAARILVKSVSVLPSLASLQMTQESLPLASVVGGHESLLVSMRYRDEKMLTIQFSSALSESERAKMPDQVKWNVFNRSTQSFVGEWESSGKDLLQKGNLQIKDDARLFRILPFLSDIQVVIEIERAGLKLPRRLILDLGSYCSLHPTEYFSNLSDSHKKCSDIRPNDIQSELISINVPRR